MAHAIEVWSGIFHVPNPNHKSSMRFNPPLSFAQITGTCYDVSLFSMLRVCVRVFQHNRIQIYHASFYAIKTNDNEKPLEEGAWAGPITSGRLYVKNEAQWGHTPATWTNDSVANDPTLLIHFSKYKEKRGKRGGGGIVDGRSILEYNSVNLLRSPSPGFTFQFHQE